MILPLHYILPVNVARGRTAKYLINKWLLLLKGAARRKYFTDKQQQSNFLPIQMIFFEKTESLLYGISIKEAHSLIQQLSMKAGTLDGYGTRTATKGNFFR